MNWNLQSESVPTHVWQLVAANQLVEVKFNTRSYSVRLLATHKRLFFIEQKTMAQNRFLFSGEYGHVIGECQHQTDTGAGKILIHKELFFYQLKGDAFHLLDKEKFPLTSCTIMDHEHIKPVEQATLLFCLAWLQQTENTSE
jgi:hypothetical protein